MLLVIDAGNTNITLGIYESDSFVAEFRLASDRDMSKEEYEVLFRSLCKNYDINECVFGSVVDELNEKIIKTVKDVFNIEPLIVTNKLNTGVTIKIDNPDELGADRIANATGVHSRYKNSVVVVDFGTAITFDIINNKGEFIGGTISPGVTLQMKVLNKYTSKLPRIEVATSPKAVATNTTDAILSGVIRGTACMVDGMIEQCEKELGEKLFIVATGGYSELIAKYMKHSFDCINPTLTLDGLKEIYKMNVKSIKQLS